MGEEGGGRDGAAADDVAVHVNRVGEWREIADLAPTLRRAVRLTLATAAPPPAGEVSLTCLPGDEMAEMHRRHLGREGPTDVIAFELGGEGELLGDVYVCPDVARRAVEAGDAEDAATEVVRLSVHGTLHLLGHDHPEGEERWSSPMYRLQERLVAKAMEGE